MRFLGGRKGSFNHGGRGRTRIRFAARERKDRKDGVPENLNRRGGVARRISASRSAGIDCGLAKLDSGGHRDCTGHNMPFNSQVRIQRATAYYAKRTNTANVYGLCTVTLPSGVGVQIRIHLVPGPESKAESLVVMIETRIAFSRQPRPPSLTEESPKPGGYGTPTGSVFTGQSPAAPPRRLTGELYTKWGQMASGRD